MQVRPQLDVLLAKRHCFLPGEVQLVHGLLALVLLQVHRRQLVPVRGVFGLGGQQLQQQLLAALVGTGLVVQRQGLAPLRQGQLQALLANGIQRPHHPRQVAQLIVSLCQQQVVAGLGHQFDPQGTLQGIRGGGVVFTQQVDLGQFPQHLAVGDIGQTIGGQRGAVIVDGLVVFAGLDEMSRQVSPRTGPGIGIGDRGDLPFQLLYRKAAALTQVGAGLDADFAAVLPGFLVGQGTGQHWQIHQNQQQDSPGRSHLNPHWAYCSGSSAS